MLKAIELHCEYLKDPIGIGEKNPRFGWIIEAHGYDVVQKSYRLQVSKRDDFSDLIWDTDIIESDQSCFVEYKGPDLLSSTRYYFRVKITDNHNRMSEWSSISFFETGLLDPSLWIAGFISPEGANEGALSKETTS